ncbi:MAG: aldo/keto reductase [Treponema sp.]|nr:aldo/keto reductase [Treponema sp.]
MEYFELNNGLKISAVGFGCYDAAKGDSQKMLITAVESGYRFFDTASLYGTERFLGKALSGSGLPRSNFFIQSKMWIDEMGYNQTFQAFDRTLNRIGTDYLDAYLIHWPRQNGTSADEWNATLSETYKALEELQTKGKIKAIGLSNFLPHHLDHILSICNVKPVVNQLEMHVGYMQDYAASYAKSKGLVIEAWSPLARGGLADNQLLSELSKEYNVSMGQVALRFVYQSGAIPLPKAQSMEHQKENMNIFDFELSSEDFHRLATLPQSGWSGEHPDLSIPTARSNFEQ